MFRWKSSDYRLSTPWFGLILIVAFAILPACQTARINQFKQFSTAGSAYVAAADAVFNEARRAVADENSSTLMLTRDFLTEERRKEITLLAFAWLLTNRGIRRDYELLAAGARAASGMMPAEPARVVVACLR